jgi:hypothetical protein
MWLADWYHCVSGESSYKEYPVPQPGKFVTPDKQTKNKNIMK